MVVVMVDMADMVDMEVMVDMAEIDTEVMVDTIAHTPMLVTATTSKIVNKTAHLRIIFTTNVIGETSFFYFFSICLVAYLIVDKCSEIFECFKFSPTSVF